MSEQPKPCQWRDCDNTASKRVRYSSSRSGGKLDKDYDLLAAPPPLNLCERHIEALLQLYSNVREEELD